MKRTRDYRRSVAKTHIAHKKWICKHVYDWPWYDNDNQYSKNKVHCSCQMCADWDAYYEWLRLHGVNDKFKAELEEAGLEPIVPSRLDRVRKCRHHYSHYSKHWN